MSERTSFRVAIKESSVENNKYIRELRQTNGEIVEYESRAEAEAEIAEISKASDGAVRLQQVAPNDPADVDAYLVAAPPQHKHTPISTSDGEWTFDITANQYGALGEVLITTGGTPALRHFATEDLGPYPSEAIADAVSLELRTNPKEFDWQTLRAAIDGEWVRWKPDCELRVKFGYPAVTLHQYFCEIKTGDASFERGQQEMMQTVSNHVDVLKIRVRIDELPKRYTVAFERVGERTAAIDWEEAVESVESLNVEQIDFE